MSLLKRRGRRDTNVSDGDERRRALREELNMEGARRSRGSSGGESGGSSVAVGQAFGQALRVLRAAVPPSIRDQVSMIERDAGRAQDAGDYRQLSDRLRALRPPAPEAGGVGSFALDLFQRVVFASHPIAQAFGMRVISTDLRELQQVEELALGDERPVRRLLLTFEAFARRATRSQESAAVMKGCVVELIAIMDRLAGEEGSRHERLAHIQRRLGEADEITDLERLRALLVRHAAALVDETTKKQEAVIEARLQARASQHRADELQAELRDAHEAARTDLLTNLGNRRAMNEEVDRATLRGGAVGVLALDLDHFKGVNDNYGHAAGDEVLRYVSDLLRGELRGDDEAFRVGGEELMVLLPEGSWQGARATAERLRARLDRHEVKIGPGVAIKVTMSIGVALWTTSTPFEDASKAADAALYRAKEGGRNRVVG